MKLIDYKPSPIDTYKGNWCLYEVTVEMPNGDIKTGSMQGDTHNWAFETFEADEV